jgi:hypothetical protein
MAELIEGMGFEREGTSLVFDIAKDAGEGLSVFLSDQVRDAGNSGDAMSGSNQWIFDIAAKTNRAFFSIGRVLTTPPRRNVEPRARLVAIANVPGAIAWQLTTRGPQGQRAYIELVSGSGVGALNGLSVVRPRPRDYFRGVSRLVTTFDTVLLDAIIADTSDPATPIPVGGLFVQFFNQATAPVNGDIPIYEQKVLPGGFYPILLDAGPQLGDARYTSGLAWALSTTPGVLTLAVGGQTISVTSVIG